MEISELRAAIEQEESSQGGQAAEASRRSPNSQLQDRILLFLASNEVESVTALARLLPASRPSVSRAINTLQKQGRARKDGKKWALTDEGAEETRRIQEQMPQQVERAAISAIRALAQQSSLLRIVNPFPDEIQRSYEKLTRALMPELRPNALFETLNTISGAGSAASVMRAIQERQVSDLQAFRNVPTDIAPPGLDLGADWLKSRAASIPRVLTEPASRQVQRLVDINVKSARLFLDGQRTSVAAIYELNASSIAASVYGSIIANQLSDANASLGRIVSDMSAMRSSALLEGPATRDAGVLLRGVQRIAGNYDAYLQDAVRNITQIDRLSPLQQAVWDVRLPTRTTEYYVSTVRTAITPSEQEHEETLVQEAIVQRRQGRHSIDDLLGQVSPHLVPMWHGAWRVLETNSADRVRQAAHSGREVLRQVLYICAPDDAFTAEELQRGKDGRPTRKMRFTKSIGAESKSAADWAENIAAAIDGMYGRLSGVSHDHSDRLGGPERQVIGILQALQGLLHFMLSAILSCHGDEV